MAVPGYTGRLGTGSDNPLGGRSAWVGRSPGYPTKQRVTVSLGTSVAGARFQLRFLIATNLSSGGPGWKIDHVAVTGLTNRPFPVQADDADACGLRPDEAGGCCQVGPPRGSDLVIAVLVLALIGARRR